LFLHHDLFANDLLQPNIDAVDKHITPILGTPDHVVLAVECDVVVRSHADYIERGHIIFKLRPISAEQGPRPTGERLSFPMPEGRGMPAISLMTLWPKPSAKTFGQNLWPKPLDSRSRRLAGGMAHR
jgi:hypothetical protein